MGILFSQITYAKQNRIALIIGNGDYKTTPLSNPVNDAKLVAKTLENLNFKVILKTNVSQLEMDDAINQFGLLLEKGGVGLFYYAGHGVQSKGRNYLIPIDSSLSREKDLKYKAVDAGSILDEMGNANNGLNIVVLDACRDNPLIRSFRSNKRGLTRILDIPTGTLLAYSTTQGKVAEDGDGENSPYTLAFVQAIKKTGLALELVFKDVLKKVRKMTHGQQTPWFTSSVEGDFYFSQATINSEIAIPSKPPKNVLKSNQHTIKLVIRSNVYHDKVKINGVSKGSTRLDLELKSGEYFIEISKEGYEDYRNTIILTAKDTKQIINAKLKRKKNKPKKAKEQLISYTQQVTFPSQNYNPEKPFYEGGPVYDNDGDPFVDNSIENGSIYQPIGDLANEDIIYEVEPVVPFYRPRHGLSSYNQRPYVERRMDKQYINNSQKIKSSSQRQKTKYYFDQREIENKLQRFMENPLGSSTIQDIKRYINSTRIGR
jgi:hypothetical protein